MKANDLVDEKGLKISKDKPTIKPKKDSKFVSDIKSNMETIKYASATVFYLVLGIALMVCAGTAIFASYKLKMYEPLTYVVRFSGIFVGLCAFVPLGKAVVKR